MDAIKLSNVSKHFGDVTALADLSLEVKPGELFGLLGNNGAGKTTAANIITGQLEPDSGECKVLGVDPVANPVEVRSQIGILPEREEPPSLMTPREYFEFVGEVHGVPDDKLHRRIVEWAGRLDFAGNLDVLCADLSRGETQMVMITQAFLHNPDLIIIDEPLVNLDPQRQDLVKDALVEYQRAGNTILLSTHRMPFAEEVCTKVAILNAGAVADVIDTREIPTGKTLEEYFTEKTLGLDVLEQDIMALPGAEGETEDDSDAATTDFDAALDEDGGDNEDKSNSTANQSDDDGDMDPSSSSDPDLDSSNDSA